MVETILAQIPTPADGIDGQDGKDAPPVDIDAMVETILAQIPTPADGRDAPPVDIDALVRRVVLQVPAQVVAADGEINVDEIVERVLARLPKPDTIGRIRLSNNNLFVTVNGRERKVGSIKLPKPLLGAFTPGGGGRAGDINDTPNDDIQYDRRNGAWIPDALGLTFFDDRALDGTEPVPAVSLIGTESRTLELADPAGLPADYTVALRNETTAVAADLTVVPPAGVTINGTNDPLLVLPGEYLSVEKNTDTDYLVWDLLTQRANRAAPATVEPDDFLFVARAFGSVLSSTVADFVEAIRGLIFDRHVTESLSLASTTADIDSNPQRKFTAFHNLKGGNYRVTLSAEVTCSSQNRAVALELYANGALVDQRYSAEMKDTRDRKWPTKVAYLNLPAGLNTFQLNYGRDYGGGGSVVTVANARLFVEDY